MIEVVIIGGGFAGLAAARRLRRASADAHCTLIDRRDASHFLPMLPDVVSGRVAPDSLVYSLKDAARKSGFVFVRETVTSVDLEQRLVRTLGGALQYDYLIIASGSETNFYGRAELQACAYTLSCVEDAQRIRKALQRSDHDTVVVAGGGYTGIEVATHAWALCRKLHLDKQMIVVERTASLLPRLPAWMQDYMRANLEALGITVMTETTVGEVSGDRILLSSGKEFRRAMLIWTAGVQAVSFVRTLPVETSPQGRLKVDNYLRIHDRSFVAGDAAHFVHRAEPLRMGVQFSITEGLCAAANIMNLIWRKPLRQYQPVDPGYVIPAANSRSCGLVLGIPTRGLLPSLLHYGMSIWRSYGTRNRAAIVRQLAQQTARALLRTG